MDTHVIHAMECDFDAYLEEVKSLPGFEGVSEGLAKAIYQAGYVSAIKFVEEQTGLQIIDPS
jgi:hypothetical protein